MPTFVLWFSVLLSVRRPSWCISQNKRHWPDNTRNNHTGKIHLAWWRPQNFIYHKLLLNLRHNIVSSLVMNEHDAYDLALNLLQLCFCLFVCYTSVDDIFLYAVRKIAFSTIIKAVIKCNLATHKARQGSFHSLSLFIHTQLQSIRKKRMNSSSKLV